MADGAYIAELTAASGVTDSDLFALEQSGKTNRLTGEVLLEYLTGGN